MLFTKTLSYPEIRAKAKGISGHAGRFGARSLRKALPNLSVFPYPLLRTKKEGRFR